MREPGKRFFQAGMLLIALFAVWTILIQVVDVRPAGETETEVGFAALNDCFHQLTGVHMPLYTITDWLGLVPVSICLVFAAVGFVQMVKRKSLLKVDVDLLLLGVYYAIVILGYLVFEMIPINFRPVFIEGRLEASYPSSTTLLVLSVMPTLILQARLRLQNRTVKKAITTCSITFSLFMVIGRLISGVHWFTDIVGSVLLSMGLFCTYHAIVLFCSKKRT